VSNQAGRNGPQIAVTLDDDNESRTIQAGPIADISFYDIALSETIAAITAPFGGNGGISGRVGGFGGHVMVYCVSVTVAAITGRLKGLGVMVSV
jgi:hypothetical protein